MRSYALAFAVSALLLTGAPGAVAQMPPHDPDPTITDGSAQQALDAARGRWAATGLRDYRFRARLICFCPEAYTTPRTLTVRDGRARKPPQNLKQVATVPRMFRVVQRAIDDQVASLRVTYGTRGLPRSIAVDVRREIADEEFGYSASRLRRLR